MKQYRLPITETAEQATATESQNGKIAKQILLGIDAHQNSYQVARKIDAGGIKPVQSSTKPTSFSTAPTERTPRANSAISPLA
jgi:hypothetical protein